MMLVSAAAGRADVPLNVPIALAVAALLAIVVTSYRQTVRAYPRGGGSYIVAKENLGTIPGLVAADAILSDYVLTVAVSVTVGTVLVTSAAPTFAEHQVLIALALRFLSISHNSAGCRIAERSLLSPSTFSTGR